MDQEEEIAGRFFEWNEEKNKINMHGKRNEYENYFRKIC